MGGLQRPLQSHVALGPMSLFIFQGGNGWQSRSPAMPLCDRDQWWSVHILDDGHGRAALVAGDKVKSSAFCESAKYQNTARGRRMLQVTRSICLLIGWVGWAQAQAGQGPSQKWLVLVVCTCTCIKHSFPSVESSINVADSTRATSIHWAQKAQTATSFVCCSRRCPILAGIIDYATCSCSGPFKFKKKKAKQHDWAFLGVSQPRLRRRLIGQTPCV